MKSKKNTERFPPGDGMISKSARKVLTAGVVLDQSIQFTCPSCGKSKLLNLPMNVISCTVRCNYCNCSIGLSGKGLKSKSIIHDPSREKSIGWMKKHNHEETES